MMFIKRKADNHSLAKIIFITTAVVLGVLALLAVLYKLRQKYCASECCCCDDDCIDDDDCSDFVEIECEDADPEDPTLGEGV